MALELNSTANLELFLKEIGEATLDDEIRAYRTDMETEVAAYFKMHNYDVGQFNPELYSANAVVMKLLDPDWEPPHKEQSSYMAKLVEHYGRFEFVSQALGQERQPEPDNLRHLLVRWRGKNPARLSRSETRQ